MFQGMFFGWLLGVGSCAAGMATGGSYNQFLVHRGLNAFTYFLLSGFLGAVLLPFGRTVAEYQKYRISGTNADAHIEAAKQAGMRAEILERRIEKVKAIRAALGLEQFK